MVGVHENWNTDNPATPSCWNPTINTILITFMVGNRSNWSKIALT